MTKKKRKRLTAEERRDLIVRKIRKLSRTGKW